MKLFKKSKQKKQTEAERIANVLDMADVFNNAFQKFIDGCELLHPPTLAEQEEARRFHEQVREAWGFSKNY